MIQPGPIPNAQPGAWDAVIADMKARDDRGGGGAEDCMDCGMCDDCIERSIAANEST